MTVILHKVAGVAITVRLVASLAVGMAATIAALHHQLRAAAAFLIGLPFVLICMGGFALNDYCDVEKDRINRPYRPLAAGVLSRRTVLIIAVTCFIGGVSSALGVATSVSELIWYGAALLGIAMYNIVVRFAALIKGIYTGAMATIPFWMIINKFTYSARFSWFPLAVMLFICGREVWMDIHDMRGDVARGIRTIPMLLGVRRGGIVAAFCVAAAGGICMAIAVSVGSELAVRVGAVVFATSCAIGSAWHLAPERWQRVWIYLCWLPMSGGLLLLICD